MNYIAGDATWRYPGAGDDLPPTSAKMLLLTKDGICILGYHWHEKECLAWAPPPKRDKEKEKSL